MAFTLPARCWIWMHVTYYGDTNAALEAQKTDLRKAQHFIFMEYHAIEDSIAWQGIEDILAVSPEKASRISAALRR